MRHLLPVISLAFLLTACNADSNQTDSHSDTTHTTAMDTTNNSSAGENHMKSMHDAMNNMMQQMQSMKPSGDADYDFAMMMKHHHQGAIDMAKTEIAGGTDEQLKAMSQKLIDEQQKEIAQLDSYMQGNQASGNSDYGTKAMAMMTPMADIKMESGSLDAMFANMMIPHHQDAVKMSREFLKAGKNEELRKVANDIISSQPKEIDQLQQWLNNHK